MYINLNKYFVIAVSNNLKLGNQLQKSRDIFSNIAEKQAEASMKMSEALVHIGTTLQKLAENDERRLENDRRMLDIFEKVLEKLC